MRIIKLITYLWILLLPYTTQSQQLKIYGQTVDSTDGSAIPYANIVVLNSVLGTSSDETGFFELLLDKALLNDTLIISSVGYQPMKIAINTIDGTVFKLNRSILLLEEVVVNSSALSEKLVIAEKFRKKQCFVVHHPAPFYDSVWIPFRPVLPLEEANFSLYTAPSIEAAFFPHKKEYGANNMLSRISLYMSNKHSPSYFMLRLVKADDKGNPGEDLIAEPIKIRVEKGNHLIRLDMDKYQLTFPPEGLFIGAELLIIEENRQIEHRNNNNYAFYYPYLNYVKTSKKSFYWVYIKGKWKRVEQKVRGLVNVNNSIFYKPAISLEVKI